LGREEEFSEQRIERQRRIITNMATPPRDKRQSEKEEPSISAEERLKAVSELESLLQQQSPSGCRKTRMKLCEQLSDILLSDPAVAFKKDCCGRLWRGCFYPQITDLRSRVAHEKNHKMSKKKSKLESVEEALRVFLGEAIVFYVFLVEKFEEMVLGLDKNIVPNLHRLYIYLGDLHRYSQDYKNAEACYLKSSKLGPGRGNPYNQLAVVAQQNQTQEKEQGDCEACNALYWYARSLLASYEAFETSRSNMQRLFASNKAWLKSAPHATSTRRFVAEFVSLQEEKNEVNLEELLKSFAELVKEHYIDDSVVVKMVTVLAFTVEYNYPQCRPSDPKYSKKQLALASALSFGSSIAAYILSNPVDANSYSLRLLSPLLLLCEWLTNLQDDLIFVDAERHVALFGELVLALATSLEPLASSEFERAVLREHASLKGFLPFARFVMHEPKSCFFRTKEEDNRVGYLGPVDAVKVLALNSKSGLSKTEMLAKDERETLTRVHRFLGVVRGDSFAVFRNERKMVVPRVFGSSKEKPDMLGVKPEVAVPRMFGLSKEKPDIKPEVVVPRMFGLSKESKPDMLGVKPELAVPKMFTLKNSKPDINLEVAVPKMFALKNSKPESKPDMLGVKPEVTVPKTFTVTSKPESKPPLLVPSLLLSMNAKQSKEPSVVLDEVSGLMKPLVPNIKTNPEKPRTASKPPLLDMKPEFKSNPQFKSNPLLAWENKRVHTNSNAVQPPPGFHAPNPKGPDLLNSLRGTPIKEDLLGHMSAEAPLPLPPVPPPPGFLDMGNGIEKQAHARSIDFVSWNYSFAGDKFLDGGDDYTGVEYLNADSLRTSNPFARRPDPPDYAREKPDSQNLDPKERDQDMYHLPYFFFPTEKDAPKAESSFDFLPQPETGFEDDENREERERTPNMSLSTTNPFFVR